MNKALLLMGVSLSLATLSVPAQNSPKLALAGVTASPLLEKKFNPTTTKNAATVSQTTDLTGVWNGNSRQYGKVFPFVLIITKAADGSQHAELKNVKRGNDYHSTSVSCRDGRITITFTAGNRSPFLDGKLEPVSSRLELIWNNDSTKPCRISFERTDTLSNSSLANSTITPVVNLDAITHAIEIQMSDRFAAGHYFRVLESDDLKSAVPAKDNTPYNLKNTETAQQFQRAGINYLLVTTVEDVKNEIVDKAQGRVAYQTSASVVENDRRKSKNEVTTTALAAGQSTQGKFDPHRVISQSVYLLVRCRLYDAATGALLDTANQVFNTNRTYIALAAGNKEVSAADLFDAAADNIANWAMSRTHQAIFPLTVLAKEYKQITINCGGDSLLKRGQTFNVFAPGKEMKDPATGEPIGRDEQLVGRVYITELQPKFSKATILEDKGIGPGNILRPRYD